MRRTHHCGTLRAEHIGQDVVIMGWVHTYRDHGGVIFADLRDRTGLVQVVANPAHRQAAFDVANQLRAEWVVAVRGRVVARGEGAENPRLATGAIEILADELVVLNPAKHPPFAIDAETDKLNNEMRLRYRFLDLRRPIMQERLQIRHEAAQTARRYLSEHGFLEVETPLLLKPTPEGARDFVVPCRAIPGTFYVLPQSPQLMKQTLMAAGFDRYFQLAKCLRDEDLRADRQYEHTQIDLEMSFMEQDEILDMIQGLIVALFAQRSIDLPTPFDRLTYDESMARYGSDKPDRRFGMELVDVGDVLADVEFRVFRDALAQGGQVKGIRVPAEGRLSRKDLDGLTNFVKDFGAKGLAWIAVEADGLRSAILKFLPETAQQGLVAKLAAQPGDVLLFVADDAAVVAESLGRLRLKLAAELGLIDHSRHDALWVTDFPLFEQDSETGAVMPMHHPFSMPRTEDLPKLKTDPLAVRAQLYDLVYNGVELGSGSVRIHRPDLQLEVLEVIGLSEAEAMEKFGFLLEVFGYGAPPHGGIGIGFDRVCALLAGMDPMQCDIREVIAFPKTSTGRDLMLGAPTAIPADTLAELSLISTAEPEDDAESLVEREAEGD